jgi:hypothetical protein
VELELIEIFKFPSGIFCQIPPWTEDDALVYVRVGETVLQDKGDSEMEL